MATGDHHVIVIICSWTALPHVLQDTLYVLPMVYDSFDNKHVKARGLHGGAPGAAAMPRVAVEVVLSTLSAKAVRDTSAWEVPHKGRAWPTSATNSLGWRHAFASCYRRTHTEAQKHMLHTFWQTIEQHKIGGRNCTGMTNPGINKLSHPFNGHSDLACLRPLTTLRVVEIKASWRSGEVFRACNVEKMLISCLDNNDHASR